MFQFQGSLDCDWKQRRKESSTIAAAASCTRGLMSSRSRLHACIHASLLILSMPPRRQVVLAGSAAASCAELLEPAALNPGHDPAVQNTQDMCITEQGDVVPLTTGRWTAA